MGQQFKLGIVLPLYIGMRRQLVVRMLLHNAHMIFIFPRRFFQLPNPYKPHRPLNVNLFFFQFISLDRLATRQKTLYA